MLYDETTRLEDALARATLAVRYETAAQRVLLAMRGLLQELRYNPHWRLQPRVLNGSEAGQWTDGFASGTSDEIGKSSAESKPVTELGSRFRVWLAPR